MYCRLAKKLEVTKDLDRANELLGASWILFDVTENAEREFVFLLGEPDDAPIPSKSKPKKPDALDALADEIIHRLTENLAKCLPPRDILQRTLHKSPSSS